MPSTARAQCFGPAQVERQDFGAGNRDLEGLVVDREAQMGVPAGQGKRKVGANEPGAAGD